VEEEIWQAYQNENFQAIALDTENASFANVRFYQEDTGTTHPVCYHSGPTNELYGVGYDYSVLIDQDGDIVNIMHLGSNVQTDIPVLIDLIDGLLAVSSVDESFVPESGFDLHPGYPNPFSDATTITYSVPNEAQVVLGMFDVRGRRVATLVDGVHMAGDHSVVWSGRGENGKEVVPGVYFARLESAGDVLVRRVLLAR